MNIMISPPLHPAPCSVSGTVESKCLGIEPWIVNAARELAMDSSHVYLIARIIEHNKDAQTNSIALTSDQAV